MSNSNFDLMLKIQRLVCLLGQRPAWQRSAMKRSLHISLEILAAGALTGSSLGWFLTSNQGQELVQKAQGEWRIAKNAIAPIGNGPNTSEGFAWVVDGEIYRTPYFNRNKHNEGRDHITKKFGRKSVNGILVLDFNDTDQMLDFFHQKLSSEKAMATISYLHAANSVVVLGRYDNNLAKKEARRQLDAKKWLNDLWLVIGEKELARDFFMEAGKKNADTTRGARGEFFSQTKPWWSMDTQERLNVLPKNTLTKNKTP